jgi:hypothetical protein
MPDVVTRLLREGWFRVMFINGIKAGIDSDLWRMHTQVMDSLIWSMTPHEDPCDRAYVAEELPRLLQRIQDGLNSVLYNPRAIDEFIGDLQSAHRELNPVDDDSASATQTAQPLAPQQPTHLDQATMDPTSETKASTASTTQSGHETAANHDVLRRRLGRMPICTWFEFLLDDGQRQRGCLQARVDGGECFIFANRNGDKVAEYRVEDLTTAVENGQAAPIEDAALFDRALESIVGRLRREAEPAA